METSCPGRDGPSADETPSEASGETAVARAEEAKRKEEAAKVAYTQAAREADAGRLDAALELYRKADELVPAAAPKFKVELTLDKLERFAEAEWTHRHRPRAIGEPSVPRVASVLGRARAAERHGP